MKKILVFFALMAGNQNFHSFCQEAQVLSEQQQQVFNILIGINQTCIKKIATLPQNIIKRVMNAVIEAANQNLAKPLFHLYRLSVNSLIHEEENLAITEDENFLAHDLWVTLIQEGFKRDLCTIDGIVSAQIRDIFLACYIPVGLDKYAIIDLNGLSEIDNK